MRKDDWVYAGHILDLCIQAQEILTGIHRTDFDAQIVLRLALTHLIQMIGEAAVHVSSEFQSIHPEVPWREIIGMRHRIVHDYLNVDEDVVWEVAQNDLPRLATTLKNMIPPEYI